MRKSCLTLQSLQQGPVAHWASVVSLQVIGSQQGSNSWHSSIDPQSHCSPSSITLLPHDLLTSNYSQNKPNRSGNVRSSLRGAAARLALIRSKCQSAASFSALIFSFCFRSIYLVRLVKKAEGVAALQGFYVLRFTTLRKLVRLNVLQTDDGLSHDAPVPIAAVAVVL